MYKSRRLLMSVLAVSSVLIATREVEAQCSGGCATGEICCGTTCCDASVTCCDSTGDSCCNGADDFCCSGTCETITTPSAPSTFVEDFKFQDDTKDRGICPIQFSSDIADIQTGPGVAAADFDNDNRIDFYIPQGLDNGIPVPNLLYRNRGDGTFEEVGQAAKVIPASETTAALWIDYNNDGWLDLFVVNGDSTATTPYYLFENKMGLPGNGNCLVDSNDCFEDVTGAAALPTSQAFNPLRGLAAGDLNNDGYMDVFIAHTEIDWLLLNQPINNSLDLSDAHRVFAPIDSTASGLIGPGKPWQPIIADFNNDGWLDVFQNEDGAQNLLWINRQVKDPDTANNLFREGFQCCGTLGECFDPTNPVCSSSQYLANGGHTDMGVSLGDYDNDGDLDAVTAYAFKVLMAKNDGIGAVPGGVGGTIGSVPDFIDGIDLVSGWNWGVTFLDADNDGFLDLGVTSGYELAGPTYLFSNNGDATFTDVSGDVGFSLSGDPVPNDLDAGISLIAADFDRSGTLDLLQTSSSINADGLIRLRRNYFNGNTNNYLVVKPRTYSCNRFAIGAIVRATVLDSGSQVISEQMRLITAGTSFIAQEPAEAFFGLGPNAVTVDVVVEWPAIGTQPGYDGVIETTAQSVTLSAFGSNYHEVTIYRDADTQLPDCNTNGVRDDCDIFGGTSLDCNANGIPDECMGEVVSNVGVTVEWLGPDGDPVLDTDYTVTLNGTDCTPDIVLITAEAGGKAVVEWRIGRNLDPPLGDLPGDIGSITSLWNPLDTPDNVKVRVGSQSNAARKARHVGEINTQAPIGGTEYLNLDLELLGDVSGTLKAHAVATLGGRIRGTVKGSVNTIDAQSIGSGAAVGSDFLSIGKLVGTNAKIHLASHSTNDNSLTLTLSDAGTTHTGDILVDGSIDDPLTVEGCFTGNICGTNLANWDPATMTFPSNINISFGLGATICGIDADAGVVAASPESTVIAKNRFLSVQNLEPGTTAIAVLTLGLKGFSADDDRVLWAGPPMIYNDPSSVDDFTASELQCAPHFTSAWGTGDIHIFGAEIVPESSYQVWIAPEGNSLKLCGQGLVVSTGLWADSVPPLGGSGQPDFVDISAEVDAFQSYPGGALITEGLLLPNVLDLLRGINFMEISATVAAFNGGQLYATQDKITGPCTCPSQIKCSDFGCIKNSDCPGASDLCINSLCFDPCGRCKP